MRTISMAMPQDTLFAPAERRPPSAIQAQSAQFADLPLLTAVLDASPAMTAILNAERQIVFCNRALMELAGAQERSEVFGKRPGEAAQCMHACENDGGCGTSDACRTCGTVLSILEALAGTANTRECRFIRGTPDGPEFFDLRVFSSPVVQDGERFCIFAMIDINHEKRRRVLERIFFHDILNTASGLTGLADILKDLLPPGEAAEFTNLVSVSARHLVDEIESQRELTSAEARELNLSVSSIRSRWILESEISRFRVMPVASGRDVAIAADSADTALLTDPILLSRVLGNMIKNALEASREGGTVTAGCRPADQGVEFWVHNSTAMPADVKLQVFQRSFSTKGDGRGLGTYSIKLLTERYLQGNVGFTSTPESGTTFFVRLPLTRRP